jgi:hypothetical protein
MTDYNADRWVGLIPPIPHLKQFGQGPFHLVLAHLLQSDKDYLKHYKAQARGGAYIMIDNSAHEQGSGQGLPQLLACLELLNPRPGRVQLVMPDVLWDGQATARTTLEAFHVLAQPLEKGILERYGAELCYVPQGKNRQEWEWCFHYLTQAFIKLFPEDTPWCIGMSKDYEVWWGGVLSLLNRTVYPTGVVIHRKPQVHLLGWGRKLWKLRTIVKSANVRIRSTDSAKPFVYASAGIRLEPWLKPPEYPKREGDYFHTTLTPEQLAIAAYNVRIFEDTARSGLYIRKELLRMPKNVIIRNE